MLGKQSLGAPGRKGHQALSGREGRTAPWWGLISRPSGAFAGGSWRVAMLEGSTRGWGEGRRECGR